MLELRAKSVVSDEVNENLKPDLVLTGSYSTNAFESTQTEAINKWTNTNKPTSFVGLKLTWLLDMDNKSKTESLK